LGVVGQNFVLALGPTLFKPRDSLYTSSMGKTTDDRLSDIQWQQQTQD